MQSNFGPAMLPLNLLIVRWLALYSVLGIIFNKLTAGDSTRPKAPLLLRLSCVAVVIPQEIPRLGMISIHKQFMIFVKSCGERHEEFGSSQCNLNDRLAS
jgi:hypothetical protein